MSRPPRAPRVAGLDLSLRSTGIAYADGRVRRLRTETLRGPERLAAIRAACLEAVEDAEAVMIEDYAWGIGSTSVISLGELGGVVRCAVWLAGRPYWDVNPKTLKVYGAGSGDAGKWEMVHAAQRHLGYGGRQHDEADALWLRALGRAVLGAPVAVDLPARNLEAVERVAAQGPVRPAGRPVVDVSTAGGLL